MPKIFSPITRKVCTGNDTFFCPHCREKRKGNYYCDKVYASIFGIPLFPIDIRDKYLQCQVCSSVYDVHSVHKEDPTCRSASILFDFETASFGDLLVLQLMILVGKQLSWTGRDLEDETIRAIECATGKIISKSELRRAAEFVTQNESTVPEILMPLSAAMAPQEKRELYSILQRLVVSGNTLPYDEALILHQAACILGVAEECSFSEDTDIILQ